MGKKKAATTKRIKKQKSLLKSYFSSITPPYTGKDIFPVFFTLLFLIILFIGFQPMLILAGKTTFSSISASLKPNTATFTFVYSGAAPNNYKIDISTSSTMKQNLVRNFGQGTSSPITITNPQSVASYYTCGRTIYWIAKATYERSETSSSVQTAVVDCSVPPTVTPQPTATPIPGVTNIPSPTSVISPGSEVWLGNLTAIYRYNIDGSIVGPYWDKKTPYSEAGIAQIGSQVWIADSYNIYRFNKDGTTAAAPISLGTNHVNDIVVVNNQVWIPSDTGILRYNFDGTPAGNTLTGSYITYPFSLAVVGSQVWVIKRDWSGNRPNSGISRINFDGTEAAAPIVRNTTDYLKGIGVVGDQVWVSCIGPNFNSYIVRYNFDGSQIGDPLTGNGLIQPLDIQVVGSEVWVANVPYQGTAGISRFNFDGTTAGPPIMKGLAPNGTEVGIGSAWHLAVITKP